MANVFYIKSPSQQLSDNGSCVSKIKKNKPNCDGNNRNSLEDVHYRDALKKSCEDFQNGQQNDFIFRHRQSGVNYVKKFDINPKETDR